MTTPRPTRVHGILWTLWAIACAVGALQLQKFFVQAQAPDACRVGVLTLLDPEGSATRMVAAFAGEAAAREILPVFEDHPEAIAWNWLITPVSPEVRIVRVETERSSMDLATLAKRTDGWSLRKDGTIATTTGAPIRICADALWVRVVFATGPEGGNITIEDAVRGSTTTLHLHRKTPGELGFGPRGPREVILAFDLPRLDAGLGFRIVTTSPQGVVSQAMLLKAWSTRGPVALDASKTRATWSPPPAQRVSSATLTAAMVWLATALWPVLSWWRRTVLSPDAGCTMQVVCWSAGYAGLLMLLYSPGIIEPDSIVRMMHVGAIWEGTPIPSWARTHWFAPGKSLVMVMGEVLLGGQALLSFLFAWWTYGSIGLLALLACGRRLAPWVLVLCMLMPHVATHAACMLPDAPTTAALCTIAAVLLWIRRAGAGFSRWSWALCVAAWMLSAFVLFTFRANAVVCGVVVFPAAWWALRHVSRVRGVLAIAWCLAMLALSAAVPRLIPWPRLDTLSASLVWEHVGMLRLAKDEELTRRHNIDALGRFTNTTRHALAAHDWITHDSILWPRDAVLVRDRVADPRGPMRGLWWGLVRERPLLYLGMKWEVAKSLLGMRHEVPLGVWIPWKIPWETAYGLDIQPRALLGGVGEEIAHQPDPSPPWNAWSLTHGVWQQWPRMIALYLPYPWIALAAVLLALALLRRRLRGHAALLLLLAGASYGAYFLITPGVHWRYFMPAFVLCIIASAAMARDLLAQPCEDHACSRRPA